MGNTLNITTGTTVTRDWGTIVAQGFVYGPKQSYSVSGSNTTTHIYLPYGDANGVYYADNGVGFTNAAAEALAMATNNSGPESCYFSFKLHFDRPISAFAMNAGWSNWNLTPERHRRHRRRRPIQHGRHHLDRHVEWDQRCQSRRERAPARQLSGDRPRGQRPVLAFHHL